ncbi:MAG: hypothetical protein J5818_02450 [Eggerthellaceae bacterium]|nr:hypothetical protein [Eggerthellaceae bacterium]
MAQPLEHVEYLSKEIGARPAGTEEEQSAALYIADQLQKEANFHAEIEEFTSSSNFPFVQAICCAVIIVVSVLAMVVPALAIPAFVLAAASAAVFVLEAFDRPILTRALARSASQNVVAKYQPNVDADSSKKGARSRKIVLVAHYDSGKVKPALLERIESFGLPWGLICAAGTVVAAVLLLLRVFIGGIGGAGAVVLNVLTVLALIVALLPIVKAVLLQMAPYNEGANNNASGVAAMMEVARRISRGSVSEADLADEAEGVAIHGEAAAIANGLVPEGAEIHYEAERLTPPDIEPLDDEERLLAAKAAIAALTGKPVERRVYGSVASNLVNSRVAGGAAERPERTAGAADDEGVVEKPAAEDVEKPEETPEVVQEAQDVQDEPQVEEPVDSGFENAPGWFVTAQQKAKRPTGETGPIQRSRYVDAIEAAEREMAERERIRQEEEKAREEEERLAREAAAREAIAAAVVTVPESEKQPEEIATSYVEVEPIGLEPEPVEDAQLTMPLPNETVAVEPINTAELAAELAAERQKPTFDVPPIDEPPAAERRRRVDSLPAIDERPKPKEEPLAPSRSGLFRMLRADVPSMSGVIRMQEAGEDVSQKPVKRAAPEKIPAIQPVEEPDQQAEVDYDMEMGYIDAPAADLYAEPYEDRYVESNEAPYGYPQDEWDDGWQERRGPERRDDQYDDQYGDPYGNEEEDDEYYESRRSSRSKSRGDGKRKRRWFGGAFSRVRLGHVDTRSGEDSQADEPDEMIEIEEDVAVADEIEKIYHFRNPLYSTEIWFVAIGSDTDAHDGALAFVNEHQSELRGAMVIEVESLGLGKLCVASEEGRFRKVNASSRIKRYMRNAQAATGITPGSVSLAGSDSIASVIQKAGFQAMHLFGEEDGKPALKGSADDVLENIDEDLLDDNVNFLMELLKHN